MTDQRQLPLEKGAEVALVLSGPGAEKCAFYSGAEPILFTCK
jgi:hypothetical protein